MSGGVDEERDVELERLRAALYAPGAPAEAAERYRAAVARAAPGSMAEPESEQEARADAAGAPAGAPDAATAPPTPTPRSPRRLRAAVAAGAVLLVAVGAALLLAPRPAAVIPDRPLKVGPAIWSGHGTNGAASPVLDGRGASLVVRLRCRGDGRILLAVDGGIRSLACAPGRTVEDDQYVSGPHGDFLVSLSLVGHPAWTASVHRVPVTG